MAFASANVLDCRARWMAFRRLGIAIATIRPMMVATINNSIRVKPREVERLAVFMAKASSNYRAMILAFLPLNYSKRWW